MILVYPLQTKQKECNAYIEQKNRTHLRKIRPPLCRKPLEKLLRLSLKIEAAVG